MALIMIFGRNWTSRALLRAQLIEEGFEVEACEDVRSVNNRLMASKTMPVLLIADLFESENPGDDIATLSRWGKLLPVWVLAGHGVAEAGKLGGRGFERVLTRPLDLGKLVQDVKDRLAEE